MRAAVAASAQEPGPEWVALGRQETRQYAHAAGIAAAEAPATQKVLLPGAAAGAAGWFFSCWLGSEAEI